MIRRTTTLTLLLLAATLGGSVAALAATVEVPFLRSEFEATDTVGIEVIGRELFAFDAFGAGPRRMRLESGEEVVFSAAQGRLGLVLTDRRALATSVGTGWREIRYGAQEARPLTALLEDRVALLVTDRRMLGFVENSASWVTVRIGAHEEVGAVRIASGTAVVVTNRRAVGLSPEARRFFVTSLGTQERIFDVGARDNLATITTSRRLLVFSAPVGAWESRSRSIR